jgi:DNA polymerase I
MLYPDEKSLLIDFCEYIKAIDPDILTGWNCVPENTLVDTKNGLVPIKNLSPDIQLNTGGEVSMVVNTGEKECSAIKTKMGWTFIVGNNHRVLTSGIPKDRNYVWEHCDNYEAVYNTPENINCDSILHIPIRQYENNTGLGLDLFNCYKAGLIYSDGSIADKWRFKFYNKDINLVSLCCGEKHRWFSKGVWCSTILRSSLNGAENLIIVDGKKRLNFNLLSRLSVEEFGAFFAGWYDGDGSTDRFALGDHTVSIEHFQLLSGFGAISSTSCNININIISLTERLLIAIKRFIQKQITANNLVTIEKRATRKDHFKYNFNSDFTIMYVRVKDVKQIGKRNCYDITTTEHNFSVGCTVHNCNNFDMPYIFGRMDKLGISREHLSRLRGNSTRMEIRGRQLFDLLAGYKRMHLGEKPSYRLDAIAQDELKRGKVHFTGKICDLWRDNPTDFLYYNFVDVELCVAIDEKDKTVEFHRYIAQYVGCPLEKTTNSMPIIDAYILRKAYGRFVLPSKATTFDKSTEGFEGATVFESPVGVQKNVVVLDLKSLYPMAMMTINASPETKDPNGELRAPNGIRFRAHPDGMVREIQSEILKERDGLKAKRNTFAFGSPEYKNLDMRQDVVKIIMNSYYGVSGNPTFRLYDRDVGSATTAVGRAILEHNKKLIEARGYKVVLGDTDSCGAKIPPTLGRENTMIIAKDLEKMLNESYPAFAKEVLNADVQYFSIKFEKLYERFFSGGKKKRYAGLLVWKEGKDVHEVDIVGFETERSDSPAVTRMAMKTLMSMVLEGKEYAEIQPTISEIIRKYRAREYTLDEIGIPGGIGKELEDYDRPDAQVRGAIYSNQHLGTHFGKNSKPKRLYIKSMPSRFPKTDVICFDYPDEVPEGVKIDLGTMIEKTLEGPITRILEPLGWNWNEFDPGAPTLSKWIN